MSQLSDSHYEEKIFPLISEGKDGFNWWGGLFGFFWFPYKGLWKEWWIYEILMSLPISLLLAFDSLFMKILGGVLCAFLIAYLGNLSNTFYQKRYEFIKKKNHLWRGLLGGFLALVLTLPMGALAELLLKSFKEFP